MLGLSDANGLLCFAPVLWNGKDPVLKERLLGLGNPEGNHGEDLKDTMYHLAGTPTCSYAKALYRYPQERFPYEQLREENQRRSRDETEFELVDTGIFSGNRFFDLNVEYAKVSPEDLLIRLTVTNQGSEAAELHLLPSLWFRNTWDWGDEDSARPRIRLADGAVVSDTGSGRELNLWQISLELEKPLIGIFRRDANGRRAFNGSVEQFQNDPLWRDLLLFNEYFHGCSGAGVGASHQTGWSAIVAKMITQLNRWQG
ncbi:hypothetical protein ACLM45_00105 [Synechococcus sp. A10-1-5-9]|uniref:hypothetical protein n=1 Tax=Synechococcus sp. A10-1-5-9 TaxID=3392295 RepID=UPI0039E87758